MYKYTNNFHGTGTVSEYSMEELDDQDDVDAVEERERIL